MVIVRFRMSGADSVPLSIDAPLRLDEVVARCAAAAGVQLGGYIAVRCGRVITADTLIGGKDEIDIFPAISGG